MCYYNYGYLTALLVNCFSYFIAVISFGGRAIPKGKLQTFSKSKTDYHSIILKQNLLFYF
jgi:hypothetical protein